MNINWLDSAIEAFSRNDKPGARNFLHAYVAEHPDDERGWFWMSRVAEHAGEKHECLKRVLDLRLAKA